MKVKGGYFKKLLFVDLDKNDIRVVPLSDDFCKKIGADNYSADPQKAVKYLNSLVA